MAKQESNERQLYILYAVAALLLGSAVWFGLNGEGVERRPRVEVAAGTGRTTCEFLVDWYMSSSTDARAAKSVRQFTGKPMSVLFDDAAYPATAEFRTKIEEAASNGADFAGRFAVAEWGCGTQCQDHAVIDISTGKIVHFGLQTDFGVYYDVGSPILITNPRAAMPVDWNDGAPGLDDAMRAAKFERRFYMLSERGGAPRLELLCVESGAEAYPIPELYDRTADKDGNINN